MNPICEQCLRKAICKKEKTACAALEALYKIGQEQDRETKAVMIREYTRQIGVFDCEVSPELQKLGEAVIAGMPELAYISTYDIRVGFVLSYESKKSSSKIVAADCRKVTGPYQAYLPFDFIVTFYEPNMAYMTDNQKKVLMLHELKHIGIGPKGLRLEPHDIEEFETIITRYGLRWNAFGNDVLDILAGGDDAEEKTKQKGGRKRQKMAT
ncbi:MAG: putative metallopeptidase [Sporomusaceae bacterium]|nr:putative metallopeptidase [Sporomusaceae bacterium]